MDVPISQAQILTWGLSGGIAFIGVISAAVWLMVKQATDRFAADAAGLRDHLRQHAADEHGILERLANENIDTRRRVGVLHERIEKLDTRLSGTPSIDSVHGMALQVERLGGDVRSVKTELTGLREIMIRLEAQMGRHESALLQERRG